MNTTVIVSEVKIYKHMKFLKLVWSQAVIQRCIKILALQLFFWK